MAHKFSESLGRGLVLLLALSTATAATRSPPPPADDPCPLTRNCPQNSDEPAPQGDREQRPHHETDLFIPAAAVVAGIGAALVVDQLTGSNWASPKELDENGPRFASRQEVGRFQVQGYVDAGWPVVVDLEADPRAETWLEVRMKEHKDRLRVEIPAGEGRRVIVVKLPGTPGTAPKVGRFSLRSAFIGANGKPLYQPLRVFGIGAGPVAVGSTTLSIIRFGPREARLATDIRYSLDSTRIFQKSVIEVLRLPKEGNKLDRVGGAVPGPLMQGRLDGSWSGLNVSAKAARGVFALQARAWRLGTDTRDRGWTGAAAPNYVVIR